MQRLSARAALGGLAAVVAGGCVEGGSGGLLSPEAPPLDVVSYSAFDSKIAFERCELFSNCQIYVMNADGTGQTHIAAGSLPRWSPDGGRLAFVCRPDGHQDICVMNADGSNLVRLTNDPGIDNGATWSPDGRKIAFASMQNTVPVPRAGCGTRNHEIYVMNVDGSDVTRLTDEPACDISPSWSHDGRQIVFASTRANAGWEIWRMRADGSGITQITDLAAGFNSTPDWSPDGQKIVFASNLNPPWLNIYTIGLDGSGLAQLTDADAFETGPQWSKNGRIVFQSGRNGANIFDFSIYTMEANGSNLTRLTDDPLSDQSPDFGRGRCLICR